MDDGEMRRNGDTEKWRYRENAKMEENKNLKFYEYSPKTIKFYQILLIIAPRQIAFRPSPPHPSPALKVITYNFKQF
jgi:hypothetical protein